MTERRGEANVKFWGKGKRERERERGGKWKERKGKEREWIFGEVID